MQSYGSGLGTIKEVPLDGIFNIGAKLFPRVRLRNNAFSEAFSDVAAICLLDDLKHKIADWDGIHSALE
jgi:hypothetical protein